MDDFPNKSKYNELSVEINYSVSDFKITLKGLRSMVDFFQKEVEFWGSSSAKGSEPISNFIKHFQQCLNELNSFEQGNRKTDDSTFEATWGNVYKRLVHPHVDSFHLLQSRTPVGQFIFSAMDENRVQALSSYHFLTKRASSFGSVDPAIGSLKAYEFLMQDESQIKSRRDSEEKAIGQIQNHIEQLAVDLQAEFDNNIQTHNGWRENYTGDLERWRDKLTERLETWQKERKQEFGAFVEESNQKIRSLEDLYGKKLELSKPVEYWTERAVDLKKAGRWWAGGLVLSIVATVTVVLWVLFSPPDSFSASLADGDPLAIKGVVLYGTVISFMAYLIKTFSKMTFSSFHLMRDAEERERLTMGVRPAWA